VNFDHLDPPRIPDADAARLERVKEGATTRRRRLIGSGAGGGALVIALVVALVMTSSGGSTAARHVTSSGKQHDEGVLVEPSTTTTTEASASQSQSASPAPRARGASSPKASGRSTPTSSPPFKGSGFLVTRNNDVYAVNPDGSGLRFLASVPQYPNSEEQRLGSAAWSPDRTQVAFNAGNKYTGGIYLVGAAGGPLMQITGQDPHTYSDGALKYSPDGRRLAVIQGWRYDKFYAGPLFVINVDGSQKHELCCQAWILLGHSWSPDGKRIFFAGDPPNTTTTTTLVPAQSHTHVWSIGPDGSGLEQLPGFEDASDIALSPDGTRLAFTKTSCYSSCNDGQIWVADIDGTNARRLTHDGDIDADPVWSPDGGRIAFGNRPANCPTCASTYIMDADGSNLTHVPGSEGWGFPLAWG